MYQFVHGLHLNICGQSIETFDCGPRVIGSCSTCCFQVKTHPILLSAIVFLLVMDSTHSSYHMYGCAYKLTRDSFTVCHSMV